MLQLDHLAVVARSLEEGKAFVEATLGLEMQPGGQHVRYGTHNLLLGLEEGLYLEVIAVDPAAPAPAEPRWFDLDRFDGAPRLHNWICRCEDMSATLPQLPAGSGKVVDLARGDLRWQMAVPETGRLPFHEVAPALIRWQGAHPAPRLQQSGARLEELVLCHPDIAALQAVIDPLLQDARIRFDQADVAQLRARFDIKGETKWL